MQSRAVAAIFAAMGMTISVGHASPVSHPFTLIDEVERSAGQGNASTQIIRSIRLRDSGQTVRLVHTLLPDGQLTLRAKDQSEETLEVLEDYCNREGLTLVADADAKLSRQAVALLACGARKEGPGSTGHELKFGTN